MAKQGASIKDQQLKYEYTTDNPFEVGSPTWTEIDAVRMSDDGSDRPQVGSVGATVLDGRQSSARKELEFAYAVKKHEGEGAEIENLQQYDDEETPIWVRETPLQDAGTPDVIGGRLGLIPRIAQQKQGSDGHHVYLLELSGTEAQAGKLMTEDPNYTGS